VASDAKAYLGSGCFARQSRGMVALCTAGLLVGSLGASRTFSGRNGLIAFTSLRSSGAFELYTIRPDGSRERRLTRNGPKGQCPAWSPDGGRVAFVVLGVDELWVMRADGSRVRTLVQDLQVNAYEALTWSPDGRSLAFVVSRPKRSQGIWTVGIQARRARRVTRGQDVGPAWSPNGRQIAFTRARNGNLYEQDIYAVSARGGSISRQSRTPTSPKITLLGPATGDSRFLRIERKSTGISSS
jgi:TolB protein